MDKKDRNICLTGPHSCRISSKFQCMIEFLKERENYLSKDVVVTKASCDIS